MKPTLEQLDAAIDSLSGWLSKPNVQGLHAGRKTVGGQDTGEVAILFLVERKGPSERPAIPPYIDVTIRDEQGSPRVVKMATDVIEVGRNRIRLSDGGPDTCERPCPGGSQIQAEKLPRSGTGTLGVNIRAPWVGGEYCLLSCNHVISQNGSGSRVFQPNSFDKCRYSLTSVDGYTPVHTYPNECETEFQLNDYDLAWGRIDTDKGSDRIRWLDQAPAEFQRAAPTMEIKVVGAKSDTPREAAIKSAKGLMRIRWINGEWAWFRGVIVLDAAVTEDGDSGAVYLHSDDDKKLRVVGMHVGANEKYSWGCGFPLDGLGAPRAAG